MLDLDPARQRSRGRFQIGGRPRSILIAALLVVGSLLAGSAGDRSVFADHGTEGWGTWGVTGYWNGPLWRCEPSLGQIVIYAPDVLTASYAKEDADQSQQVWWTPRIWWANPDGSFHHTYVAGDGSDKGWYWAWVRPGNSYGGLIAFPDRGSTAGGAGAVSWSDVNGVTQVAQPFTIVDYPDTTMSKTFMVEYIFYWAANADQPQDGWTSRFVDMGDGYGGRYGACRFP